MSRVQSSPKDLHISMLAWRDRPDSAFVAWSMNRFSMHPIATASGSAPGVGGHTTVAELNLLHGSPSAASPSECDNESESDSDDDSLDDDHISTTSSSESSSELMQSELQELQLSELQELGLRGLSMGIGT